MTIKKLSLAAILTVSLAASTMIPTMAETLPLLAACPLAGCNKPVTPENAPCPDAAPAISDEGDCVEEKADCDCDVPNRGCRPKKERCKKSKCRCEEKCAECAPSCEEPATPATAMCPSKCDNTFNRQVYAYPQFVFGNPNYTGSEHNGIGLGYSNSNYAYNGSIYSNGTYYNMASPAITGAAAPCGCDCGCADTGILVNPSVPKKPCEEDITGAAAPMPVIGGGLPTCGNAVPVHRDTDTANDIVIQS